MASLPPFSLFELGWPENNWTKLIPTGTVQQAEEQQESQQESHIKVERIFQVDVLMIILGYDAGKPKDNMNWATGNQVNLNKQHIK